jgi:23S rRNA pseudouridine1911/1915/1917 synthase
MFKDRTITKKYLALVEGQPEPSGTITIPLIRHPTLRNTITTSMHGRPATTLYSVQEYFKDSASLEVELVTGRTHQIRVHCKAIKHPLIGDTVYNKKSHLIARQALHAYSVAFTYKGIDYGFTAPLPNDMQALIEHLRSKKP